MKGESQIHGKGNPTPRFSVQAKRSSGLTWIGHDGEGADTGTADVVLFHDLAITDFRFSTHDYGGYNGPSLLMNFDDGTQVGTLGIANMGAHIERFIFADGSILGSIEATWGSYAAIGLTNDEVQNAINVRVLEENHDDASVYLLLDSSEYQLAFSSGDVLSLTGIDYLQFADTQFSVDDFIYHSRDLNETASVTVRDQRGIAESWILMTSVIQTSDPENDTITHYQLWDEEGGNSWWADGNYIDASKGAVISADTDIWLEAAAQSGTQKLWVRAFDGVEWGSWQAFELETRTENSAPVVTIDDQVSAAGQWKRLADVIDIYDAEGDTIEAYKLWDSVGDHSWWVTGHGTVDATTGFVVQNLEDVWIWFQGDETDSFQTLWVQASDGFEWSAWESFSLETRADNTAPTVSVDDQVIGIRQSVALSTVINTDDADGHGITAYNIWDSAGEVNWLVEGVGFVDASNGYIVSDLSTVSFIGDNKIGTQTLWIQVSDGLSWSEWQSFTLETESRAPTVTIDDMSVDADQWVFLPDVVSVHDDEGDVIVNYELWDEEGGNNWWVDGQYVDASLGFTASSDLNIWFWGDGEASTQTLWIRGHDGLEWSAWDQFQLTTL